MALTMLSYQQEAIRNLRAAFAEYQRQKEEEASRGGTPKPQGSH